MPQEAQKISFVDNLYAFVRTQAHNHAHNLPKAVPIHVSAVKQGQGQVDLLELVIDATGPFTLPKIIAPQAHSKYHREPTQVGDKGVYVPGTYYIGGESGQGGGVASLFPRGNLTTGVFHPVSNTGFEPRDPNMFLVTGGPSGHTIQSQDHKTFKIMDALGNLIHNAASGVIHVAGSSLVNNPVLPFPIPAGLRAIVHLAGNVLQGGALPIPAGLAGIIHLSEGGIAHIADNALNAAIPSNLKGIVHFAQQAITQKSLSGIITHASMGGAINIVTSGGLNIGAPSSTDVSLHDLTPPVPTLPTHVSVTGGLSATLNITAQGSISCSSGGMSGQGGTLGTPTPIGLVYAPQTVTGARGGNTALQSLLTALSTMGLITDGTTP
jgi:hypothetical protein